MAETRRAVSVCGLRPPNLFDRRNDSSGHADSAAGLVSRHVVGDDAEERRQRFGATASAGAEEL